MSPESSKSLRITITATDPPFSTEHGVLFGLQVRKEVKHPVPAVETTVFETDVVATNDGAGMDFKGPCVQGRKGDRFIYLSWGVADQNQPFVMFARAKIKLSQISPELLGSAQDNSARLFCDLEATNAKGQPASGTIKGDAVRWRL